MGFGGEAPETLKFFEVEVKRCIKFKIVVNFYLKFFFFPPLFVGFASLHNTSKKIRGRGGGRRLKPPNQNILATPLFWNIIQ